MNFAGHGYRENNPITIEELEEIGLPPASENSLAETAAQPMPITGAPLTCLVSANNETFCKVEDASQPELLWSVYNEQEEKISSESFEVQTLPSDAFWDIKIIFHEPIDQISVEASNASADIQKSKVKSKVNRDHNFEQMLTRSYTSPQWGVLKLLVNPDMSVSGTYSTKKLKGKIFGSLDLVEASISGRWEERGKKGKLKHSGEFLFNIIFDDKDNFHIDGIFVNEGDDEWHDWDLIPVVKDQMTTLFAL